MFLFLLMMDKFSKLDIFICVLTTQNVTKTIILWLFLALKCNLRYFKAGIEI